METATPLPPSASAWSTTERVLFALILLAALSLRVVLVDRPFSRNSEGVGCFYGQLARNYLRQPWSRTKLVPVQSMGTDASAPVKFYHHHPPLVPLLIAGSYALFGDGEWQTRLPTVLFTLGCVAALHLMLRSRGYPRAGLVAAFVFAFVPMTIVYGGHPDCINPQLVFFVLLTVAGYLRFHGRPSATWLGLTCLAFAGAMFTDWPAAYVVPVLTAHWLCTKPPRAWPWVVALGGISVALFAAAYGHIAVVVGDWHWMAAQLARRTISNVSDRNAAVTWGTWLRVGGAFNLSRHTMPVLLLAALWLAWGARRMPRHDRARTLVLLLLAYGVLHVVIGRQAVSVHPWWWWPLTPGLVLAAALAADAMVSRVPGPRALLANGVLVAALVAFAAWTCAANVPIFYRLQETNGGVTYTTAEIGDAIRRAAAGDPNGTVAVAYGDSYDLTLWYYGDRPLKLDVWDAVTLQKRMTDNVADLPFGYTQAWPHPVVGYVIPKEFVHAVPGFVEHLRATYPHHDDGKFLTFDLRTGR